MINARELRALANVVNEHSEKFREDFIGSLMRAGASQHLSGAEIVELSRKLERALSTDVPVEDQGTCGGVR